MGRWAGRAALVAGFVLVLAVVGLLPSATSRAEPSPAYRQFVPLVASDSSTGSQPGTPGSSATQAADDLATASTSADREAVLQSVFQALGIGVYAADGTLLAAGAEKSAQDFYYYEPELETLAGSLVRSDRWSFDDIAAFLNAKGLLADGATVTALQVQAAVAKAIGEAAANPGTPAAFESEFVHELGLKHSPPDDLANIGVATSAMTLDAAQRAVILDDFLVSLPRASAQVAASSSLAADTRGVLWLGQVAAQGACGDFKSTEAGRNLGKFLSGFIDIAGKAIQVATLPLDAFHGATLAYGVKVEALTDNLKTHYGHEDPGKELDFPVRVRMLDDVTQAQIDCGWLAGITFPRKGPIPNIKIDWDSGTLESHGTVTCGVSCQQTGDDGVATLKFQPKQEKAPYTGRLTSEHGRVEANALYLSSLGNMFGAVNETVTPKTADFVWEVEWHAKGSWEGQVTMKWQQDGTVASGTTDVTFELGLAAPGEGDTHTNVYQLTHGSTQWTQSIDGCVPGSNSGSTSQDAGSAALTVTETDGTMTYEFASFGSRDKGAYTVTCGDDEPVAVNLFSMPAGFPFPLGGPENPRFKSEPGPVSETITGSTTLVIEDATVTWTWKLTKK